MEHGNDLSPTCKGGNVERCHSHAAEMGLVFNTLCPFIFRCYNKIPEMFSGKLFWLTALKTEVSVWYQQGLPMAATLSRKGEGKQVEWETEHDRLPLFVMAYSWENKPIPLPCPKGSPHFQILLQGQTP